MKKIIFSALSLVLLVMFSTSCDKTYTDLMTANVKTGGILTPTKSIPYKLGGTPSFNISLNIPKGPGIESVDVYRSYTGKSEVFDQTVSVGSANASADVVVPVTYTYSKLATGLGLPDNEGLLAIGDAWTLRFVSNMADGRKVGVSSKSTITVANKYAGFYQCVGTFTHPVNGPRAVNEKKFLTPVSAYACWGNAGDLGGSGYFVKLAVDPVTNLVTCSTYAAPADMANYPGEPNYYDPADGTFHLSYFYVGATGNRVMREVWTPIP
jgi:hypothetical protein